MPTEIPERSNSLGDDFPKEQARCRELLVTYATCGPSGGAAASYIRSLLAEADQVAMRQDVVGMISVYQRMVSCAATCPACEKALETPSSVCPCGCPPTFIMAKELSCGNCDGIGLFIHPRVSQWTEGFCKRCCEWSRAEIALSNDEPSEEQQKTD